MESIKKVRVNFSSHVIQTARLGVLACVACLCSTVLAQDNFGGGTFVVPFPLPAGWPTPALALKAPGQPWTSLDFTWTYDINSGAPTTDGFITVGPPGGVQKTTDSSNNNILNPTYTDEWIWSPANAGAVGATVTSWGWATAPTAAVTVTYSYDNVPEPASMAFLMVGALGLMMRVRRSSK
ncbi:MAG: PEP-CTERM sorting domain-containing protein [Tepidisphaeraceae bacterium]